jgi:8-oxo-dGTP diphosphatase
MRTTAKHITPALVAAIRRADGNYLMTDRVQRDKHDKGYVTGTDFWQLPGGGIEVGETVEDGLKREIREETGLEIEIVTLLPKIFTSIRPAWHGIIIYYLCRMKDENQPVELNHESSRFGWFPADEIKGLNSFPETYEAVKMAENIAKLFF